MKRKLLSILLVLGLLVTAVVPTPAIASGSTETKEANEVANVVTEQSENGITISYGFVYPNAPGRGGGVINVTAAEDGDYYLYWGSDNNTNLDGYKYLSALEIKDGKGKVTLNKNLLIPEGATHLLMRPSKVEGIYIMPVEDELTASFEIPVGNRFNASVLGESEYAFGTITDVHAIRGLDTTGSFSSLYTAFDFYTLKKFAEGDNVLFIGDTGDLVDYATGYAFERYANAVKNYSTDDMTIGGKVITYSEGIPYYPTQGNHDALLMYSVNRKLSWPKNSSTATEGEYVNAVLGVDENADFLFGTGTDGTKINYNYIKIDGTDDFIVRISPTCINEREVYEQMEDWLTELIASNPQSRFFVYQHVPIPNEAGCLENVSDEYSKDANGVWIYERWKNLISENQNIVVINGHAHHHYSIAYNRPNIPHSDGNGDLAAQFNMTKLWGSAVGSSSASEWPEGYEIYKRYKGTAGNSNAAYHKVYENGFITYAVDLGKTADYTGESPKPYLYEPIACYYTTYNGKNEIKSVTPATIGEESSPYKLTVSAEDESLADGIAIAPTAYGTDGEVLENAVFNYRVTDENYNTVAETVANVQNGKLYFGNDARNGATYKILVSDANYEYTTEYSVDYLSVYLDSITFDTSDGIWKVTEYTIDNTANTITITMPQFNPARILSYAGSENKNFVDDTVTTGTLYTLEGKYAACGLYNGDILTVSSASGLDSVDYKVIINYPAINLEGKGTKEEPYLVKNADDFAYIQAQFKSYGTAWSWPAYFKQTADFDYTGALTLNNNPRYQFRGHYNGDGHTINFDVTQDHIAVFSAYLFGTVENLTIAGKLTSNGTTDVYRVYGIAPNVMKGALVRNVHISASMSAARAIALGGNPDKATYNPYENVLVTSELNGNLTRGMFWSGATTWKSGIYSNFTNPTNSGWKGTYTIITDEALASGEMAVKLDTYAKTNGLTRWGQKLGKDIEPKLASADRVYYYDTDANGTSEYTNTAILDAPKANVADGETVKIGTKITLATEEDAAIYYTIDGSDPTTNGKLYIKPIIAQNAMGKSGEFVVKAYSAKEGAVSSAVATYTYNIDGVYDVLADFDDVKANSVTVSSKGASAEGLVYGDAETPYGNGLGYTSDSAADDLQVTIGFNTNTNISSVRENQYFVMYFDQVTSSNNQGNSYELFFHNTAGRLYKVDANVEYKLYNTETGTITTKTNTNRNISIPAGFKGWLLYPTAGISTAPNWAYTKDINFAEVNKVWYYTTWGDKVENFKVDQLGVTDDVDSFIYFIDGKTAEPTVNKDSGEVSVGTEIIINAEEAATVYYTLDGTEPNENSTVYTKPIVLDKAGMKVTLKTVAIIDGFTSSNVITRNYTTSLYTVYADFGAEDNTMIPSGAKSMGEYVKATFGRGLKISALDNGSRFEMRRTESLTNIAGYDEDSQALVMYVSLPETANGANYGDIKLCMNHHSNAGAGDPYAYGAGKELTLVAADGTVSTVTVRSGQFIRLPSGFTGWIVAPISGFEVMSGWSAKYSLDASLVKNVWIYRSNTTDMTGWVIDQIGFTGNMNYFVANAPSVTRGDANNDGTIDICDVIAMDEYKKGNTEVLDIYNADLNNDGKVDTADAIILRRYRLGIIDKL